MLSEMIAERAPATVAEIDAAFEAASTAELADIIDAIQDRAEVRPLAIHERLILAKAMPLYALHCAEMHS